MEVENLVELAGPGREWRFHEPTDSAEGRLSAVLDRTVDLVLELDRDWHITFGNREARICCSNGQDFTGTYFWEIFPQLLGTPAEHVYWRVMKEQQPVQFEGHCKHSSCWYGVRVYPTAARGLMIFLQDINARKQAEAEMCEAKEEAERASLAKSRFLASASHDLRQPVQSLFLFAGTLERHVQDSEGRAKLRNLERGLDTLKQLLDRLLDASRLDIGQVKPDIDAFPLHLVFEHLKTIFEPVAASRNLVLEVAADDLTVWSDPLLLSRILRSVVENAVRYTEEGRIVVSARRVDEGVMLSVSDTGIGIPSNQIAQVWDEFYQVANLERDRQQGLGLGLSIVRRLANLLGHKINLQSEVGKGSTFTMLVPEAPKSTSDILVDLSHDNDDAIHAAAGRFIVVVDDDALVLMALKAMLEDWNCHVLVAGSASHALEQLRREQRVPDVVIADYRLREGKVGTDAVRDIRKAVGKKIPAVLLTGETAGRCCEDALAHGLGFLQKPVTSRHLQMVITQSLMAAV